MHGFGEGLVLESAPRPTVGVPNLGLRAVTQPVAAGDNALHSRNAPPHPPIVQ